MEFLINDHVLFQRFCNLNCDYCYGFYPKRIKFSKKEDGNLQLDNKNFDLFKEIYSNFNQKKINIGEIAKQTQKILAFNRKHAKVKILKISGGGELFLFKKEAIKLIKHLRKHYRVLQILTNATLLDEKMLTDIKSFGNVHLQFSIDGIDIASNFARIKNLKLQERVISYLNKTCELEIPLEINCVVTKYNCTKIFEFAKYLSKFKKVLLVPRPIRGEPKRMFGPSKKQIKLFEQQFLKEYKKTKSVLPPNAYMEELLFLLKNNKRNSSCRIPCLVLSSFDNGDLNICTCNSRLGNFGNLTKGKEKDILQKIESFNLKFKKIKRINGCESCMNQYDILNLYLEDRVSDSELKRIPLYSDTQIFNYIKKFKAKIK